MNMQLVSNDFCGNEQPWAGVPAIDDVLVCPNCGWQGHNSELVVSGYDTDFLDQVLSGECNLECPDCRADAGHMLHGWSRTEKVSYCTDDLETSRMAMNALALTFDGSYEITPPVTKPARATSKARKPYFERRLTLSGRRPEWTRTTKACEHEPVQLCLAV